MLRQTAQRRAHANAERLVDSRHYPELLAELKSISELLEEARLQLYLVLENAVIASGTTREEWERELEATMIRLIEEAAPEREHS
jgi:hypothetical protein